MNINLPIIKTKVSYFEMLHDPQLKDISLENYILSKEEIPSYETYINIYREVGRDYIWNYRPGQTQEEIEKIIQSPHTEIYYLRDRNDIIGMAEIDLTKPKDIEIVHFGLLPQYVSKGIGKKFFQTIVYTLWKKQPNRIWLATCDLDHHKAPNFYSKAGFKLYKETENVEFYDYRYSDFYEMTDAQQIPH